VTDKQLLDWMARVSAWRKETDDLLERLSDGRATVLHEIHDRLAALEAAETARKARKKPDGMLTADETEAAQRVLGKLNEHGRLRLRPVTVNGPTGHVLAIVARLRKGATEHECRLVCWHRSQEWADDEQMRRYLRPSTLFGGKFDEYLDQAREAFEAETGDDPDELTADNAPAAVIQLSERLKA